MTAYLEDLSTDKLERIRVALVEWRTAPRGLAQLFREPWDFIWPHKDGVPAVDLVAEIDAILLQRSQDARSGKLQ